MMVADLAIEGARRQLKAALVASRKAGLSASAAYELIFEKLSDFGMGGCAKGFIVNALDVKPRLQGVTAELIFNDYTDAQIAV